MRVKHILVSRVAIKWRHQETGMSWEEWLNDSFQLYDTYCRPSIINQIEQDFTLLSIVDESVVDLGDVLDNEEIIRVGTGDVREEIINGINGYVETIKDDYDYIILTRIDRDDCLRKDFTSNVKKHLLNGVIGEKYVDLYHSLTYDVANKRMHNSDKYFGVVSPFVSIMEKINDGKIKCLSFLVDHNMVNQHLKGVKVNDLVAIQVIHENNLKNKIVGNIIDINFTDFNLKK